MKRAATLAVVIVAACVLLLQWEQLATLKTVAGALRSSAMTDPGPMEIKSSYLSGYNDAGHTQPVYEVITTTRNAPSETWTHTVDRHAQAIKDRMEIVPPYGG